MPVRAASAANLESVAVQSATVVDVLDSGEDRTVRFDGRREYVACDFLETTRAEHPLLRLGDRVMVLAPEGAQAKPAVVGKIGSYRRPDRRHYRRRSRRGADRPLRRREHHLSQVGPSPHQGTGHRVARPQAQPCARRIRADQLSASGTRTRDLRRHRCVFSRRARRATTRCSTSCGWQRRNNLRSPDITRRDLVDSDERIAAHTDGLVLAGPDGMQRFAAPGLESGEGSFSLASGYVAARDRDRVRRGHRGRRHAGRPGGGAGRAAPGAVRRPDRALRGRSARGASTKAPAPAAVVAAEALAFHGPVCGSRDVASSNSPTMPDPGSGPPRGV